MRKAKESRFNYRKYESCYAALFLSRVRVSNHSAARGLEMKWKMKKPI